MGGVPPNEGLPLSYAVTTEISSRTSNNLNEPCVTIVLFFVLSKFYFRKKISNLNKFIQELNLEAKKS